MNKLLQLGKEQRRQGLKEWLVNDKSEILRNIPKEFCHLDLNFQLHSLIDLEKTFVDKVPLEEVRNETNKEILDYLNTYIGEVVIQETGNDWFWEVDMENDYDGINEYVFYFYIKSGDGTTGLVPNTRLPFALNKKTGSTIHDFVQKKVTAYTNKR